MTLTIETTYSRFCGKPTKKWYHATSMMVTLVGIKGSRRLYGYSPSNAPTLFIKYKGEMYCLQSSFGPQPGDTFELWGHEVPKPKPRCGECGEEWPCTVYKGRERYRADVWINHVCKQE